jgi:hypothetical protein
MSNNNVDLDEDEITEKLLELNKKFDLVNKTLKQFSEANSSGDDNHKDDNVISLKDYLIKGF